MANKRPLNPDELVWVNSDSRASQRPDKNIQGIKQDEVNPDHYTFRDKELWEQMVKLFGTERFLAFCELNAFKYRMRAGVKTEDPTTDINKAKWYENKIKKLS